jgi:hypothetical protein
MAEIQFQVGTRWQEGLFAQRRLIRASVVCMESPGAARLSGRASASRSTRNATIGSKAGFAVERVKPD